MLRLGRIRVSRFRSLWDVDLALPDGLCVLTGMNDGGKTATLDAIALLLGGYSPDQGDTSHRDTDGEGICVEGIFADDEGAGEFAVRALAGDDGAVSREVKQSIHAGLGAVPAALPLTALKEKMAVLAIPLPGGAAKQPYVDAVNEWLATQSSDAFADVWVQAAAQELDTLPQPTLFRSSVNRGPDGDIAKIVSREARRFLKEDVHQDSLGDHQRKLNEEIQPSLQKIKEQLGKYCPDLDAVEVEATFDFSQPRTDVRVTLVQGGRRVDLAKTGEGRRRRATLAVHEANLSLLEASQDSEDRGEFLLYDEPDTHLDYSSQRDLFEIVSRQASLHRTQVVVATHSMNFIDRAPLVSVVHFRLTDAGETALETLVTEGVREDIAFLTSVATGLGLRNSVLLDERCFLVVEGETEEAALPAIFKLVLERGLTEAGITLVNTKGSSSIMRLVEVLVVDWRRAVVVLADRDAQARLQSWAAKLGLKESVDLFFLGAQEFEDAFTDEVWLGVLDAQFPPAIDAQPWTLQDLARLRQDPGGFADALCHEVRVRCKRNVGKPDLGAELARSLSDKSAVPETLAACLVQAADRASVGLPVTAEKRKRPDEP